MMTTGQSKQTTSPTLSSILNNKKLAVDTPMKEFLPTPVTPATDFSQFNKKDTSSYSTFSVIKPPTHSSSASSSTPTTSASNNTKTNSSDIKPYPCPECHQTFSRPHNLKSHLTTHSSERPFQCDVCNHHFRRHHDLKRHQKLHTGERPYVCKDCYRSFARLDALNRHRRAEGGTACSAVHQQVKQNLDTTSNATYRSSSTTSSPPTLPSNKQKSGVKLTTTTTSNNTNNHTTTSNTNTTPTTTSPQRPVIPQLHIPHPASHLYPKDNYPIPPTHSPPQQLKGQLLPSPSALSTLPIANNNNLTPIYHPQLPNTPSSPPSHKQNTPNQSKSPLYHPYQQWSPYSSRNNNNERPTLPPLSASPPAISNYNNTSPKSTSSSSQVDRLLQENEELKRDINQIRAMAQKEAATLKSRLHDLEVENKVLRSLIHNPVSTPLKAESP